MGELSANSGAAAAPDGKVGTTTNISWMCPEDMVKTRPCMWLINDGACKYGESCVFAHSREELRAPPPSKRTPKMQHWSGDIVSIGVVELAMSSEPPPLGVLDVVCNRCSCLGNPFAYRVYGSGEERPPKDADGWCAAEHEELCSAFNEYLAVVLGEDGCDEEALAEADLTSLAKRIADRRRLTISECWLVQCWRLCDVRKALAGLEARIAGGIGLRLLCHCRPHVRCHTEFLKAFLEVRAAQNGRCERRYAQFAELREQLQHEIDLWPSSEGKCSRCVRCSRQSKVMDPGMAKVYCSCCWLKFVDDLHWRAKKVKEGCTEELSTSKVLCRYFNSEIGCIRGVSCAFSHDGGCGLRAL